MASTSATALVQATNRLMQLAGMGDKRFQTLDELQENASSLVVAVFETVFGTRIADIKRRPQTKDEYSFNAQRVLDSLRAILPPRVPIPEGVSGEAIAAGEARSIEFVVSLMTDITRVIRPAGQPHGAGAISTSDAGTMAQLRSKLTNVGSTGTQSATLGPPRPAQAPLAPLSPVQRTSRATPTKVPPPPVPHGSSSKNIGNENMDSTRQTNASHGRSAIGSGNSSRAAQSIARQQQMVMKRMQHESQEELKHIQAMMQAAIKTREAEQRVAEASAIRAATVRAKSAKHERKVLAQRTQRIVEDLTRHTLSMRIARSSRQAAAAQSLLRAVAAQQRLGAAAQLKAAADERAADLMAGQARIAWLNEAARAMNEVILEETAKQVAQRQAAIRSQKEALQRALSDMHVDESALLNAMKAEQAHAEAVFLAQNVEPMDMGGPLGGGAARDAGLGMPDGAGIVSFAADPMDTDVSTQRVDTVNRVRRHLGSMEKGRSAKMGTTTHMMRQIGMDTGKLMGQAAAMVDEAQEQVAASMATMQTLGRE